VTQEITLEDLESWAAEAPDDRLDVLRIVALIEWVNELAGFRF
jgi:hypothetical protein